MVQARVGDRITVFPGYYDRPGQYGGNIRLFDGRASLRVTRVFADRVLARGRIFGHSEQGSVWVPKRSILTVNDTPNADAPRRLGVKPEDTDEVTHLPLDHPGIQWIFRDMAAFADGKRWCNEYDNLADELGIPGRDRDFDIEIERGGITFTATVYAPTLAAAQAKAEALFVSAPAGSDYPLVG